VLLYDLSGVLGKVGCDCFALMSECVLEGWNWRLGGVGNMGGWRVLWSLCQAATDGVWPAVGHGKAVVGPWRDDESTLVVFDVFSICELMGVYAVVAVMLMYNHGDEGMPVLSVVRVRGTELVVDGVEEGVGVEVGGVDGVSAGSGKVGCEGLDASIKVCFVDVSKVGRVCTRIERGRMVEVLV